MSIGNYIGYFAYLIEQGKMTEDEANKELKHIFEADMRADEEDRKMFEFIKRERPELIRPEFRD